MNTALATFSNFQSFWELCSSAHNVIRYDHCTFQGFDLLFWFLHCLVEYAQFRSTYLNIRTSLLVLKFCLLPTQIQIVFYLSRAVHSMNLKRRTLLLTLRPYLICCCIDDTQEDTICQFRTKTELLFIQRCLLCCSFWELERFPKPHPVICLFKSQTLWKRLFISLYDNLVSATLSLICFSISLKTFSHKILMRTSNFVSKATALSTTSFSRTKTLTDGFGWQDKWTIVKIVWRLAQEWFFSILSNTSSRCKRTSPSLSSTLLLPSNMHWAMSKSESSSSSFSGMWLGAWIQVGCGSHNLRWMNSAVSGTRISALSVDLSATWRGLKSTTCTSSAFLTLEKAVYSNPQ